MTIVKKNFRKCVSHTTTAPVDNFVRFDITCVTPALEKTKGVTKTLNAAAQTKRNEKIFVIRPDVCQNLRYFPLKNFQVFS